MRPPDAGSVTAPARRVTSSPYAGADVSQSAPSPRKTNNAVLYIIVAFAAAVAIMYVRGRGSYGGTPVQTGPVLTLQAPAPPDQSQIDNLTNSINALAGQVHTPSPVPSGGASTPITNTGA